MGIIMFKIFGFIVYLFLNSMMIKVAYAASIDDIEDYDHQIEEELEKFTENIIKFSFEKPLKKPLEILALFQIGTKLSEDIVFNLASSYNKILDEKLLTLNGKAYKKNSPLHDLGNLIKNKKFNENFIGYHAGFNQVKNLNITIYEQLDIAAEDALLQVKDKMNVNEFSNEQDIAYFFLKLNTLANLRSYNMRLYEYLDLHFNFFSSYTEGLDVNHFIDLIKWDQFYRENFEITPNQSLKFFEPWNIALRYCMVNDQIMVLIFAHKNGNFAILPRELIRVILSAMIFCPEILSSGYTLSSSTKSAENADSTHTLPSV